MTLWHVSAASDRDSILLHGLLLPGQGAMRSPRWLTSRRLFLYAWMELGDARTWAERRHDWYGGRTDVWRLDLPHSFEVRLDERDWSLSDGRHGVALIARNVLHDSRDWTNRNAFWENHPQRPRSSAVGARNIESGSVAPDSSV